MDCVPGAPLPSAHYEVAGRPKEVRYWAAEALDDPFVPNREVDRLIWLPPPAARARLTQERDRELLDALVELFAAGAEGAGGGVGGTGAG